MLLDMYSAFGKGSLSLFSWLIVTLLQPENLVENYLIVKQNGSPTGSFTVLSVGLRTYARGS